MPRRCQYSLCKSLLRILHLMQLHCPVEKSAYIFMPFWHDWRRDTVHVCLCSALASCLDRNGCKIKLDKILKERKCSFPLLIKVWGKLYRCIICLYFNCQTFSSSFFFLNKPLIKVIVVVLFLWSGSRLLSNETPHFLSKPWNKYYLCDGVHPAEVIYWGTYSDW